MKHSQMEIQESCLAGCLTTAEIMARQTAVCVSVEEAMRLERGLP